MNIFVFNIFILLKVVAIASPATEAAWIHHWGFTTEVLRLQHCCKAAFFHLSFLLAHDIYYWGCIMFRIVVVADTGLISAQFLADHFLHPCSATWGIKQRLQRRAQGGTDRTAALQQQIFKDTVLNGVAEFSLLPAACMVMPVRHGSGILCSFPWLIFWAPVSPWLALTVFKEWVWKFGGVRNCTLMPPPILPRQKRVASPSACSCQTGSAHLGGTFIRIHDVWWESSGLHDEQ